MTTPTIIRSSAPPAMVDRLAKLEREHAAVMRWLAAKDAEKGWAVGEVNLSMCSPAFRELDEMAGETIRALADLEKVAREVREG